jgi:hypothetical protein
MTLTSQWLDLILKTSSLIHKQKEKLVTAEIFTTLFLSIAIILLELFLFIISLPSYFFIGSKKLKQLPKNEASAYSLRRKVSLAAFFGIIIIIAFWIILFLVMAFFAMPNQVHSVL